MVNANSDMQFKSKIEELKGNLIELSEKNIFLNFNWTNSTVPIIDVDFYDLFSKLVIEKNIFDFTSELKKEELIEKIDSEKNRVVLSKLKKTLKRVENFENSDDLEYYSQNTLSLFKNPDYYINRNEDLVLNTPYNKVDLLNRLDLISLKYKKSMNQEGVANLYLALGFVDYKNNYAPLIFIPVSLKKVNNQYKLSFNNFDEIKTNEYLNIQLEKDGINLPKVEIKNELDMITYLTEVNELVDVKPLVTFGLFNFKNIELYNDLNLDKWSDDAKSELNSLLFNKSSKPANIIQDEVAEKINEKLKFPVYEMDLAQTSVIEEAKLGDNLVINTLPGTNKTETIINLICELIANKKTILYVSQKMNEVKNIEKQLNELGLNSIYLNLFGDNYNNLELLSELDKTSNYSFAESNFNQEFYDTEIEKLNNLKIKLNNYSEFIQNFYKNTGFTPYNLLGLKESNLRKIEKSNHELNTIEMKNLSNLTNKEIDNIFSQMTEFIKFYSKNITSVTNHKFNYIVSQDLTDNDFVKIIDSIPKLRKSLKELIDLDNQLNETYGIEKLKKLNEYEIYKENTQLLYNNPQIMGDNANTIKDYVNALNDFQIKIGEYGSIEELEKHLTVEVYNTKIDLKQHFDLINETNEKITNLNSLLNNFKSDIDDAGIKEINSIEEGEKTLSNLELLDKNPSLIDDEAALDVFIEDIEIYQDKFNKNTPDDLLNSINNNSISLYDNSLNKLTDLISNKKNINDTNECIVEIQEIKKEIGVSKLECIDDFSDDLSKCELLLEDPKIIEDEDDLIRFFDDYKEGFDKFSELSHEEYYTNMNDAVNQIQDDIAEELSKSNVLESNLPIIISEINRIINNNEKLVGKIYSKDIKTLNQIEEYLDNINLLLKDPKPIASEDKKSVYGYISLLEDFKNEEPYTKLALKDVNDAIAEIIKIKNQLIEFNFDASVFDLDLSNLLNKMKDLSSKIKDNPLAINPIYDKNIKTKFEEYKNTKFKLISRFTSDYGKLKSELKSYYKTSSPRNDDIIISDYENFFKLADEYVKYRNQILDYYHGKKELSNIIYTLEHLNSFSKQFEFICKEFKDYLKSTKFNEVLSQLVLYRLKLSEIEDFEGMDNALGKYFPNTYFRELTDLNELYKDYEDIETFNGLQFQGFYPKDVKNNVKIFGENDIKEIIEEIKQSSSKLNYYISLINKNTNLKESTLNLKNVFSKDINELKDYCVELLSEIRKSNDLFSDSLDNYDLKDIDELIRDYVELNSLEKIKSFLVLDTFEVPLNEYKVEYQELCDYNVIYDNNKELIDTYYENIWVGRTTSTESITNRFNICKEFTNLFNDGFFTKNTITFYNDSSENIVDKISNLKKLCNDLTQKVSLFKNELVFYNDDLVKLELGGFNTKNNNVLATIELLQNYNDTLLQYDKNNLINMEETLIDSTKTVDNLNGDFDKLFNDSKFNDYDISFEDEKNHLSLIKDTISKYNEIVSLRDSINERKIIFNNHFVSETNEYNIWIGPNTSLSKLKNKSNIDKEFSKLYGDNFFTDKTINLIKNNPSVFNGYSTKIKNLFEQIRGLLLELNENSLIIHDLTDEFKDLDFKTVFDKITNIQNDFSTLNNNYSSVSSSKIFNLDETSQNIKFLEDIVKSIYINSLEINQTILNNHIDSLNIKLTQLNELYDLKDTFDDMSVDSKYFNHIWEEYDTSVDQLNQQIIIDEKYEKLMNEGFYDDKINIIFENKENFEEFSTLNLNKQKLTENCSNYLNSLDLIHTDKGLNFDKDLGEVLQYIEFLDENIDDLKNWRKMQKYCKDYDNECTGQFINAVYNDNVESDILIETFNYNFANNLLNEIIAENDFVNNEDIEEYNNLDSEIIELNRIKLLNELKNSKPVFDNISDMDNDQVAQYRGYSKLSDESKRKNPNSIKEILKNSIDYIICLKPVFMMNPMSVAQYLDSSKFESYFDYIIFDDINYSNVENGITSLLRAKTKIILGDVKQSCDSGILGLCYPQFKDKSLKWHYQSKDESLIEFSNNSFYNNDLIVYPSVNNNKSSLKHVYLKEAVYNPKTKYNEVEAEKIVEYAINHFEKYGDEKTLGIITSTKSQKDLIINTLINKLYNLYPQLINYFNPLETFFIEDVEHVDETRDIILVSLTYGLDKNKKFNNYFDLDNKNIINQLLTKSHEKTILFSNIDSEDIQLYEETPENILTFKSLLNYVENSNCLNEHKHVLGEFEQSVYEFLIENGFKVEKEVGVCGNYIDLAILDDEDKYVLAIECDGENFNKFKSSRDRLKNHQHSLKISGWNYYYINAAEWLNSREDAQNDLIKAVQTAFEKSYSSENEIVIDDESYIEISDDEIEIELDDAIDIEINDDIEISDEDIEIEIDDNLTEIDMNEGKISIDNLIELFSVN